MPLDHTKLDVYVRALDLRFYRMARRSATETAAILDILDRRQAVAASVLAPALELLERVVAMLARPAGQRSPPAAAPRLSASC